MHKEYTVVEARSIEELIKFVNSNLANGWMCIGGISTVFLKHNWAEVFRQAMVRT